MPPPEAPLTPEQVAALAEKEKIHAAFIEVFGVNGTQRTNAQTIVLEALKKACYAEKPVFAPDKEGHLCPLRAAWTDGKRAVWISVNEEISFR